MRYSWDCISLRREIVRPKEKTSSLEPPPLDTWAAVPVRSPTCILASLSASSSKRSSGEAAAEATSFTFLSYNASTRVMKRRTWGRSLSVRRGTLLHFCTYYTYYAYYTHYT